MHSHHHPSSDFQSKQGDDAVAQTSILLTMLIEERKQKPTRREVSGSSKGWLLSKGDPSSGSILTNQGHSWMASEHNRLCWQPQTRCRRNPDDGLPKAKKWGRDQAAARYTHSTAQYKSESPSLSLNGALGWRSQVRLVRVINTQWCP